MLRLSTCSFPATLLIGPIWGQNDSVLVFFLMLAVYFLAKDRPVAAALAFSAGFIVKPQAVAALPFLLFWVVRDHPPQWRRVGGRRLRVPVLPSVWLRMVGSSTLLILVGVSIPSFRRACPGARLSDWHTNWAAPRTLWPMNSFFAFNFWTVLGKDIADRCDRSQCVNPTVSHVTFITHGAEFLGLSTRFWGWALFAVAIATVLYVLRNARGPAFLALGTSLSILAFYLLTTRMHERYVFPFFLRIPRRMRSSQVAGAVDGVRTPGSRAFLEPVPRLHERLRRQLAGSVYCTTGSANRISGGQASKPSRCSRRSSWPACSSRPTAYRLANRSPETALSA